MTRSLNDDGSRTAALLDAAKTDPESVDVSSVVDAMIHRDRKTRNAAFEVFETIADSDPTVLVDATDHFGAHLEADEADQRRRAALTTAALANEYAEELARLGPELRSIGEDISEPGREPAVLALARIALARPADTVEAVDTFVDMACDPLCDDRRSADTADVQPAGHRGRTADGPASARRDEVRVHAVAGLTRIAATEPEAISGAIDDIADLLDDENSTVRAGTCEVLEAVAGHCPSVVESAAPALAERAASDPKHPVPWRAADALNALGTERPEPVGLAVAPVIDDLDRFFESSDADRRATGATLLAHAAAARPGSIQSQISALERFLSDEAPTVRAAAAFALGHAGKTDTLDRLATLAESDPAEDVREAAARARRRLKDSADETS